MLRRKLMMRMWLLWTLVLSIGLGACYVGYGCQDKYEDCLKDAEAALFWPFGFINFKAMKKACLKSYNECLGEEGGSSSGGDPSTGDQPTEDTPTTDAPTPPDLPPPCVGEFDCPCYNNNTCNNQLTCLEGTCQIVLYPPMTGGSDTSGGGSGSDGQTGTDTGDSMTGTGTSMGETDTGTSTGQDLQ